MTGAATYFAGWSSADVAVVLVLSPNPGGWLWTIRWCRLMMAPVEGSTDHGRASCRCWGLGCLTAEVVDCQAPDRHLLRVGYATTTALIFVPKGLTEPGLLPGGATPHGVLENVLGSAVPAFIVAALVSGKAGVRNLAVHSFRWRVPPRW
jgi:hypothetical protein